MLPASAPGAAASTTAPPGPRPEILAPAGDFDCARAAVENGADAVYFGLSKWNARARAANFSLDEARELLAFLHLRGVKGYVALNTLVYSTELDEAAKLLERVLALGPDAFILQDLGLARLLHDMAPGAVLHASTQTTTTSAEQLDLLRELGFSRVILARELSLDELRRIRASTSMELEVFVHGALCVAYSGQCLTSEALGGRSANRGACAQACRLPYELVVDGRVRDLGDRKYLISPQDLAAYELVPELSGIVQSLKIEGRLKTPEYVAAATRAYRKAVDRPGEGFTRDEVLGLQQVFSRGLSHGFLDGVNHQVLVPALSPKKRGILLGRVGAVAGDRVAVLLEAPLKPGDGIVFDYGRPEDDEPGGRVTHVWKDGIRVDAADAPDAVEFALWECPAAPQPGWRIWKTSDPARDRALRATFERTGMRSPVDALVEESGGNLKLTYSDGRRRVSGETGPLQEARTRPLTEEYLRGQLGRLGDTPFVLRNLEVKLGRVMVPVSLLNDLRRRLARELVELRRAAPVPELRPGALDRLRPPASRTGRPLALVALCRSMEQLGAVLAEGVREVECEFEDVRGYRDAVALARSGGARIVLAPPRIFKPGEQGILRTIASADPHGVLLRSTAHLSIISKEAPGLFRVGDYSLNTANELTAGLWLARGVDRLVPSFDLNWDQFQALARRVDPGRLEAVVHHAMPMFHMEHCVFAALLSEGRDHRDCGRPCDRHRLALRDRTGMEHPLRADVGCRNTIFNAVPQSAGPYLEGMKALGIRCFRVELLRETSEETRRLVKAYRDALEGRASGDAVWRDLRASNVMGVTRGPLGRDDVGPGPR
jgi:putative protease